MDLFAYSQIENLSEVAKVNGIDVPRLRGYRLMSNEHRVSPEEIKRLVLLNNLHLYEWACCSVPRFAPNSKCHEFSSRTQKIKKKYLVRQNEETVGFRWDLLHGNRRKRLKYDLKVKEKALRKQMGVFNKYVGRFDVLCIHARIGGRNWAYYGGRDIEMQPWFLEKVDDYFDSTYCDIYARLVRE